MFLSDITLVFVFELFSNMGKKAHLSFWRKYEILLCLLFSATHGNDGETKIEHDVILRGKAKEYKRNMMKICLDIFLAPIILKLKFQQMCL
jgi:hypothetical protein